MARRSEGVGPEKSYLQIPSGPLAEAFWQSDISVAPPSIFTVSPAGES